MSRIELLGVVIAAMLLTHAFAYVGGWHRGYASSEAKWAKEKADLLAQADAKAKALQQDGARLAAELERAKTEVRVQYVEKIRTVYRTASKTKECLSGAVVSALNKPVSGGVSESKLAKNAKDDAKENAPETESASSEMAVAEWIAQSQSAYEQCRQQVGRLADWVRSATRSQQQ